MILKNSLMSVRVVKGIRDKMGAGPGVAYFLTGKMGFHALNETRWQRWKMAMGLRCKQDSH